MPQANELRLFVSSTFRDMQGEREYLVKKIFPEIRGLCRRRGVVFTEIDLRWGLTEEEGALGRVIRTCLEEVDKCRPYFVGIIGDRYGWVPEYYEVMMDPDLVARYPWVEEAVLEGTSVTEMEFTHGVFSKDHDPNENRAAFFYHRKSDPSVSDADEKLGQLIERIKGSELPLREFSSLEEVGQQVRDDLVAMIDRYWPESDAPSELELERRSHAAFAASRRRAYILNPLLLKEFRAWMEEGSTPLVVRGASGLGKSSLMAYLGDDLRRKFPDRVVVEHYVGASEMSGTARATMLHLMREIADLLDLEKEIPTDPEEVEEGFRDWLFELEKRGEADGLPPVIFIDALNQLGDRDRSLRWLPRMIPSGVRLAISTTPGEEEDELLDRGWQSLEVLPIEEPGPRKSIVVRYLGEFHKGISSDQLESLAHDPKGTSPLYLRLVAEELRLHGEHETLADEIARYTSAESIDDVFQLVLDRLENDYGREEVADLLGLIFLARSGLTESELTEMLSRGRLHLSHMLFALDYHLIRKEGVLDFFHDYLRRGVERRYMGDAAWSRELRLRIADHFQEVVETEYHPGEPLPVRLAQEICHQLREADAKERLASQLATLPIFTSLSQNDGEYDLLSYWRSCASDEEMVERYDRELKRLRNAGSDVEEVVDAMEKIGGFYLVASRFDPAVPLLRKVYRYRRLKSGPNSLAAATGMEHLATTLYHVGKFPEAEELWEEALKITEKEYGKGDPSLCPLLDSLGAVSYKRGNVDRFEEYSRRSLEVCEAAYGREHPQSIDRLLNLGEVHIVRKMYGQAISILEDVVRIGEQTYGSDHPKVAKYLGELGYALSLGKQYEEATERLQRADTILSERVGEHVSMARVRELLGHVSIWTEKPSRAEHFYKDSYQVRMSLQGDLHPDTLATRNLIASALRRQKKYDESEEILREVIPLEIELLGADHPRTHQAIRGLALLLDEDGREDEAAEWWRVLKESTRQ